jgi:glycosyltransferase involved in cell wall biosynthesis
MIPGLVSVVIPVYNREGFIAEAIESALGQQDAEMEILVVDDGSTDGTISAASRYGSRIRLIRQENAGPPAARNRGIADAQGEFLTFLDSDDLWPSRRTRVLLDCLQAHPEAGAAMGRMQYIPVDVSRSSGFAAACGEAEAIVNYNLSASLFRASALRAVGLFDESMRYSDDWDWFVRAREKGVRIELAPEVTLINRRHGENLSNQREIGNHYTLMMLKKSLDRRRAGKQKPPE